MTNHARTYHRDTLPRSTHVSQHPARDYYQKFDFLQPRGLNLGLAVARQVARTGDKLPYDKRERFLVYASVHGRRGRQLWGGEAA